MNTGTVIEIVGAVVTVLAVAGAVLNNHRRRECFMIWLVSNGLSLACHVMLAAWSLAVRDGVFWLLAVHGWVRWGRNGSRDCSGVSGVSDGSGRGSVGESKRAM